MTAALLTAGLVGPAAGEPAPDLPETVSQRLDGLPAAQAGARTSKAVETPMPFSMVGFEVPPGTELEFRTSPDGKGDWGAWTEVEVDEDEGPDPGSAEALAASDRISEPVWVGDAAGIQTRISGAGTAARPERVKVHLIDSSGLGRSWGRKLLDRAKAAWRGAGGPAAEAVPSRPAIVTRAQWGANESWRKGSPSYASGINLGILHHTAGSNGYTRAQSDDVVRAIYRYHTQSNGWSDIGYNFLVDKFGTIYEGRYGGITKAVIGAHAGGFNTRTFGVSMMGSYDGVKPRKATRRALRRLLAWKYDIHHTSVLGTTTHTSAGSSKYSSGTTVRLNRLSGHRDVSSTACPGGLAYSLLPRLRKQVAERQGPVLLDPRVSRTVAQVSDGRLVDGPIDFAASLRPGGSWVVRVFDPSGNRVFRKAGSGTGIAARWSPTNAVPGNHQYKITSPDRRGATGTITLRPPPITASASPTSSVMNEDGTLRRTITFSGRLSTTAQWTLSITPPGGSAQTIASNTSSSFSVPWNGPGPGGQVGTYRWTLQVAGGGSKSGTVRLLAPVVERAAPNTDPAAAAAALSQQTFGLLGASRVVLTRADYPQFALPAGPLAGKGGPVLYTGATSMPAATLEEVGRVLPPGGTVYVLGNTSVISSASVAGLSASYTVKRLGGATAQKVAAKAANQIVARSGKKTAVIAGLGSGKWRQSAAAAGFGARKDVPILFTKRGKIPAVTARALRRNGITRTRVVGDTSSVSEKVRKNLPSADRVARGTPADTAVAVARKLYGRRSAAGTHHYVFFNLARDDGWVRVLAAAPYSARRNAPPLHVKKGSVANPTKKYLRGLGYSATVMGSGTGLGNAGHAKGATLDALSGLLQ